MTHEICDACEFVAHCQKHGCIPLTPQPEARRFQSPSTTPSTEGAAPEIQGDVKRFGEAQC